MNKVDNKYKCCRDSRFSVGISCADSVCRFMRFITEKNKQTHHIKVRLQLYSWTFIWSFQNYNCDSLVWLLFDYIFRQI